MADVLLLTHAARMICRSIQTSIVERTMILVAGVLNKALLSSWILAEKSASTVFKWWLLIASRSSQYTMRYIHAHTHKLTNIYVCKFFLWIINSVSTVQPCMMLLIYWIEWTGFWVNIRAVRVLCFSAPAGNPIFCIQDQQGHTVQWTA